PPRWYDCGPSCCRVPRDARHLHPFPTRRSSDLAKSVVSCWICAVAEVERRATAQRAPPQRQRGTMRVFGVERAGRERTGCTASQDRKSTRLNSSHVKISYAVFCLKKKNGDGVGQ